MIDYLNMKPEQLADLEREAYNAGDTDRAALLAALSELAQRVDELEDIETLAEWEHKNGPADAYVEFFHDCFGFLDGHYPAPSVTSDYDKSVIFEAIRGGAQ